MLNKKDYPSILSVGVFMNLLFQHFAGGQAIGCYMWLSQTSCLLRFKVLFFKNFSIFISMHYFMLSTVLPQSVNACVVSRFAQCVNLIFHAVKNGSQVHGFVVVLMFSYLSFFQIFCETTPKYRIVV